jgi:putative aldouronate transport system substrate-binding protein
LTGTIGLNTLDPYFGAFKAFPKGWIKDEEGRIAYGSTTANTKQALGKLSELYRAGLIDEDFGTVKPDQYAKDISAGKAGIGTGYTSAPMKLLADSVKNNPAAVWDAHYLVAPDGSFYTRQPDPLGRIMVVKKGAKHAEAIILAINVMADMDNSVPGTAPVYMDSPGTNWSVRPIQATFRKDNTLVNRFQRLKDAADGKLPLEQLPKSDRKIVEDYLKGFSELAASPQDWAYTLYQYRGGNAVLSPLNVPVYNEFYGMTDTMEEKWGNLLNLENESFMRIIVGDKPLDYFETFVSEWRKQGGDTITREVEKEIAKQK